MPFDVKRLTFFMMFYRRIIVVIPTERSERRDLQMTETADIP